MLALCVALTPRPAAAGWWDDAGAARPVSFEEAADKPPRLADIVIRFRARVTCTKEAARPTAIEARAADGDSATRLALTVTAGTAAAQRASRLAAVGKADVVCIVHAVVRRTGADRTHLEALKLTAPTDPLTPEEAARLRQANAFLKKGNPKAAHEWLQGLLDARRHDPGVRRDMLLGVARSCIAALDQEGADKALREALALDARDQEAALLLADLAERGLKAPRTTTGREGTLPPLPSGPGLAPPGGRSETPRSEAEKEPAPEVVTPPPPPVEPDGSDEPQPAPPPEDPPEPR